VLTVIIYLHEFHIFISMAQIPIIKYDLQQKIKPKTYYQVIIAFTLFCLLAWLGLGTSFYEFVFAMLIFLPILALGVYFFSNEYIEEVHVPIKIGSITLSNKLITILDTNLRHPLEFSFEQIKSIHFLYSSIDYEKAPNLEHRAQEHIVLAVNYDMSNHRCICPVNTNGYNIFEEFKKKPVDVMFVDEAIAFE